MTEEADKIDAGKELQGRVEALNGELVPLLQKYELNLGASAFITPEGLIAARPIVLDARKAPEAAEAEAPAVTAAA